MIARLMLCYAILLIITPQSIYGQEGCCCNRADKSDSEPKLSGELLAMSFDNITYFNKDWLSGDIFLSNGEIVRNKLIKYNGLIDEFLWKEPKSESIIKLDKEAVQRFHFLNVQGDTSVYFRKIKVKRDIFTDSSEIYGQEIYHGKISLFILHTFYVERREIVSTNTGYFQKEIYAEEPIYFLRFMNNKVVGFKNLNRKNLYAFIPDKKDQVKGFFKQTKQPKIETYPDIIMLMKFLNSIADQ